MRNVALTLWIVIVGLSPGRNAVTLRAQAVRASIEPNGHRAPRRCSRRRLPRCRPAGRERRWTACSVLAPHRLTVQTNRSARRRCRRPAHDRRAGAAGFARARSVVVVRPRLRVAERHLPGHIERIYGHHDVYPERRNRQRDHVLRFSASSRARRRRRGASVAQPGASARPSPGSRASGTEPCRRVFRIRSSSTRHGR